MSVLRQSLRAALAHSVPRRWLMVKGPAAAGSVCLTFDDGPHAEHTPRVLDALREHRVAATFFVIGEQAERHPELIRRMAAEGHAIGHHSYFHAEPAQVSSAALMEEVGRTGQVLEGILGGGWGGAMLFRPPKGELTAGKMVALRRAGMTVVLWNVDPKDYKCAGAEALRAWFTGHPLKAGDIVLLHDVKPFAAAVIGDVAGAVRRAGLEFGQPLSWRRRMEGADVQRVAAV